MSSTALTTEDHLTNYMPRKLAEELLAAEAQTKQHHVSAFEEAERLRMVSKGCPGGMCEVRRPKADRVYVTLDKFEVEV